MFRKNKANAPVSNHELPWKKNVRLSAIKPVVSQTTENEVKMLDMRAARKVRRKFDWTWWISRLAILGFVGLVLTIVSGGVLFMYFSRDLPDPNNLVRRSGYATKILDRNDVELYDVYDQEKRIPVKVEELPQSLKLATIAIEDKDFYTHQGFDLTGILRGFSRLFTRGRAEGGSTLTQQLVKNVLLTSERSVTRKIREFVLAIQIERKFSKDQILQMYLNEAPYGGTAWGVGAASEMYFNKPVSQLNLTESVILAGLPQSP